jgi:hypothetical protein
MHVDGLFRATRFVHPPDAKLGFPKLKRQNDGPTSSKLFMALLNFCV